MREAKVFIAWSARYKVLSWIETEEKQRRGENETVRELKEEGSRPQSRERRSRTSLITVYTSTFSRRVSGRCRCLDRLRILNVQAASTLALRACSIKNEKYIQHPYARCTRLEIEKAKEKMPNFYIPPYIVIYSPWLKVYKKYLRCDLLFRMHY